MKYNVKQLNKAMGRNYIVLDDNNVVFTVQGSFAKIPKMFEVKDLSNNVIATVTKDFMKLYAQYNIKIDTEQLVIKRNDVGPIISLSDSNQNWTIDGDLANLKFKSIEGSSLDFNIKRRLFKFYTEFELEIYDVKQLVIGVIITMIIADVINV